MLGVSGQPRGEQVAHDPSQRRQALDVAQLPQPQVGIGWSLARSPFCGRPAWPASWWHVQIFTRRAPGRRPADADLRLRQLGRRREPGVADWDRAQPAPRWLTRYPSIHQAALPIAQAAKEVRAYGVEGDEMALRLFDQQAAALGRLFNDCRELQRSERLLRRWRRGRGAGAPLRRLVPGARARAHEASGRSRAGDRRLRARSGSRHGRRPWIRAGSQGDARSSGDTLRAMTAQVAPRPRVLADLVPGAFARDVALVIGAAVLTGIVAQFLSPCHSPRCRSRYRR